MERDRLTKRNKDRALSQFYSTRFRLASEPHQTLVIIPCQLARNRVAFCEEGRGGKPAK